jgi:hypothetical protein
MFSLVRKRKETTLVMRNTRHVRNETNDRVMDVFSFSSFDSIADSSLPTWTAFWASKATRD